MHRIMFLGTTRISNNLTESCLRLLASSNLDVVSIVSNNNLHLSVEDLLSNQLSLCEWLSTKNRNVDLILESISKNEVDTLISVYYPWILPVEILHAVNGFAFNLHNGKLPNYKGWNILSHMILNKEKTATTTIHWMAKKVDMGDIVFEESVQINLDETAQSLLHKLTTAAQINFKKLIYALENDVKIPSKPVEGEGRFYNNNEIDELKIIRNPLNKEEVDLKARAFYCPPYDPAYYILNGQRIYVYKKSNQGQEYD